MDQNKEYFEKYLDEKFGNLNKRLDGFQVTLTGQTGSNGLVGTVKEHKMYFKIMAIVGGVLVMSYLVPLSYSFLDKKIQSSVTAGLKP